MYSSPAHGGSRLRTASSNGRLRESLLSDRYRSATGDSGAGVVGGRLPPSFFFLGLLLLTSACAPTEEPPTAEDTRRLLGPHLEILKTLDAVRPVTLSTGGATGEPREGLRIGPFLARPREAAAPDPAELREFLLDPKTYTWPPGRALGRLPDPARTAAWLLVHGSAWSLLYAGSEGAHGQLVLHAAWPPRRRGLALSGMGAARLEGLLGKGR